MASRQGLVNSNRHITGPPKAPSLQLEQSGSSNLGSKCPKFRPLDVTPKPTLPQVPPVRHREDPVAVAAAPWGQINNKPQPKIGQVTTKKQVFDRNSCFLIPHVCFRSIGVSTWKEGLFVSRLL
ncbi:hypothetical protein PoMZ_08606 [Pyricularia oryzae]|uniref:Uncharacterized protein n=1 Tax=Pyricularia oryzae TaxID=318829 RepID=A0A4P7NI14_PYROR|nr:hypothetical protein PoMZ_08606 [Pyricularia oryzae]